MSDEKEKKTAKKVLDETTGELEETTKKGIVTLVAGSENWDFEENPEFIGRFQGENIVHLKEKNEDKRMGFIFEDEDGETWIIPDWADIIRALEVKFTDENGDQTTLMDIEKPPLVRIVFKGEVPSKKGAPRKAMKIDIIAW